jgi:hypothetical protein
MKKEEDLPEDQLEDDPDFDGMEDNDQETRISAIDLAIKAVAVSGSTKDPGNILGIAIDFYRFIIGEDE